MGVIMGVIEGAKGEMNEKGRMCMKERGEIRER
jgi:hypothetical protein